MCATVRNRDYVRAGKKVKPTCAVEGCQQEPEFHMGRGGWTKIYIKGPGRTLFLCAEHRDKWFEFNRDYTGLWKFGSKVGENGWLEYWDRVFKIFLRWVKGDIFVCPFCGQETPR